MFGTGTGTATGTGRSTGTGIATCVPTRVGGSVTRAGTTGAGAGAGALPIVSVGAGADTTGAITGEARSGNGMGGTRSGEEGKLGLGKKTLGLFGVVNGEATEELAKTLEGLLGVNGDTIEEKYEGAI